MRMIDIRSDTVTKPTEEMRLAMYNAEVGDDVCGDDPTVIELEKESARVAGKEAAIFVPSGTFGNQLSLFTHCSRGNEVILDESCHIVEHEAGAASIIAGVQLRAVNCPLGILDPGELEKRIRKERDIHFPETGLVCVENAHSSGRAIAPEKMKDVYDVAHRFGIPVHLDGARLFNAAVSMGTEAEDITKHCDSVMFCLSKGLGAPVGSILAGTGDFIERARYKRKIMGGGMRQAGVLAAPGLIALKKMAARLDEDHANADTLAKGLGKIAGVSVFEDRRDINMVFFRLDFAIDSSDFKEYFFKNGIKVYPPDQGVFRFVTNFGVSGEDVLRIVETLKSFVQSRG
ncbi:MAG: aminotransferase class I/II-fold pyridoxal phosphate-dependent enzyme [Clostridia bacterium]|nr:aminotransferase class I/II-fold pyridoxal phosphate-dependent enzyme [Clostridia bacterium]